MSEARRVRGLLEAATLRATKALILDINSEFHEESPVDTGYFKSNWIPGIGDRLPSSPVGSRGSIDSGASQSGQAKIATSLRFGQNAYIVNAASYADTLARGHSSQAPAGWVDAIVEREVRKSNAKGFV